MDPRGSPPWFGAITVKSNFGRNRWPRCSRKFEFCCMVIFLRFWPIFWPQWDPIDPKMDPRVSPQWFGAITLNSNFGWNRWARCSRKFEFLGHGNYLRFRSIFFTQWDPIGPKMDPRGSPQWLGVINVKLNFGRNGWPRGSQKFEFWGMVIFCGFDQFFGPNETPLALRWTLGGPHRDMAL